jgi:hypothetical protein
MLAKPDQFAALKLTQLSAAIDHNFGDKEHNKKRPNFSNRMQIFSDS